MQNLSFNKFDTQGGLYTLTSVKIDFTASVNAAFNWFINSNPSGATFNLDSMSVPISVQGPAGQSASAVATTGSFTDTKAAGVTGLFTYSGAPIVSSSSVTLTNPADLTSYTGPGGQTYNIGASGGAVQLNNVILNPGSPNAFASGSGSASGTVTVTYGFLTNSSAAPEPGSVALLGTGLLGMAGVSIRRRKKSAA